ncbi:MAG: helix-turn-helix transcriptional regulator [Planctomycetes bacterium]|nr:helix-turn-helix transcriptional regulator [Planctomycetota bacterium]
MLSRSPTHVSRLLAQRLRVLRLERNWKRETLAKRAGVSPSSLKRFETSGRVSLENLLKLCHALGRLSDWDELLRPLAARSLAELEQQSTRRPTPKRGRK